MDCLKLNLFRHSSMYLCERESKAFLKSMSRIRDSILFHQVQDVDDAWSNYVAWHIRFLLLPYYSTNHWPKPLSDTIPTLGVNNLLLFYWDMIIYSYEKGSLTLCPGNEGVPAMSKTSWGSLFGPVFINISGYRQQSLLIARTWNCVPLVSKFLCLCPEFECNLGPKREPHWLILLTTRTPSFAGHEVRLPVSW